MAMVENNEGVISKTPLMLPVNIRPPFWRTNWAIALYCLLAISFLYLIIYLITKWQRRKFLREQKAALTEQLHKMDEMKLRFFTNVSHEFRTPLTLIITPVEQLLKETKDPEDQKMLQIVHQHARQLLNLVNQLLDFRKIDVQKLELLVSSGDIVLFVKNITFAFKALADRKSVV